MNKLRNIVILAIAVFTIGTAIIIVSFNSAPQSTIINSTNPDNSPFGAHGKLQNDELLSQMGIKWIRLAGPRGLHYKASQQNNFENALNEAEKNNLNAIVTVSAGVSDPNAKICTQKYPENIDDYKKFLKDAVNKYKNKVKYYQFENEPSGDNFWCDTAENYAKLLKHAYLTVKTSCPECQVLMAGATSRKFGVGDDKFFDNIFSTLKSYPECAQNGCHDIFDLHLASCDICLYEKAGVACEANRCSFKFLKTAYDTAKSLQQKYDFIKPLWSTEFGTFGLGNLENTKISLIKSFVYTIHLGFEKLFWRVAEDCCKILDDGQPTGTYYAYKTLIEQTNNYSTLTKLANGQYKFAFSGKKPVYVLWRDSDKFSLPFEIQGTVRVIDYLGKETLMNAGKINPTKNPIFVIPA